VSNATVAVNTTSGVATFVGTSLTGTVGSYTVSYTVTGASSSSIASASQVLNLTHGSATYLAFVQRPTSARAGISLSDPVVVKVTDADGNLVDTGNFSSGSAVLSIGQGAVSLSGTVSTTFSAGIATFSNLAITGSVSSTVRLRIDAPTPWVNHFPSTPQFSLTAGLPSQMVSPRARTCS
jgi:uncharacterized protein YfaS (alpha-2-macroglobulin family)